MAGRIWSELTKTGVAWSGLGYDHGAPGAVLLSGLDASSQSLSARAGRTLKAGAMAHEAEDDEPPRRSFFARKAR